MAYVVTPPSTVGVPVNLPKTSAAQLTEPKKPLVISLDKTGRTFIGEEPVEPADLKPRLAALAGLQPAGPHPQRLEPREDVA